MHIGGKIFGAIFGYMLFNLPGLLIGLYIGHRFDRAKNSVYGGFSGFNNLGGGFSRREDPRLLQQKFFHATFATMGHMAKATGQVTQQDLRVAMAVMQRMQLQGEVKLDAQKAFNEGKTEEFSLDEELNSIRENFRGRADMIRFFLEVQLQAAFADGQVQAEEREVLYHIADGLGFSRAQLDQWIHMQEAAFRFQQGGFGGFNQEDAGGSQQSYQQATSPNQLADAYRILGVKETATRQELKRAHRKLMNEHHPDKLVSKGLPPEMIEVAKQKAQEIQAAYDLIRKNRGFK